ncbi:integrase catalytic domain-containing protein [Trichonephila inaurata madagascariensis]|uniref:Integrase catalytic domain-containing protein n=1 Tax=Trichonephila inaurata madagascariensis TaxID=2747483 RepID=A0A8X6XWX1_9ARAC|nr:integrase catalytic domain-containing protein [Trichonephila inaurata madagascariensis]
MKNAAGRIKVDLSELYDLLESKLMALESLGRTKEKFAEFLEPLVESCLPEIVLRVRERSRSVEDSSPQDRKFYPVGVGQEKNLMGCQEPKKGFSKYAGAFPIFKGWVSRLRLGSLGVQDPSKKNQKGLQKPLMEKILRILRLMKKSLNFLPTMA